MGQGGHLMGELALRLHPKSMERVFLYHMGIIELLQNCRFWTEMVFLMARIITALVILIVSFLEILTLLFRPAITVRIRSAIKDSVSVQFKEAE
jgi:hypothetical protein